MSLDPRRRWPATGQWLALIAALLVHAFSAAGASGLPELDDGKELWRGDLGGAEFRLVQIPERTLVYVPIRLFFEATGEDPELADSTLRSIEGVRFEVADGNAETALGYGSQLIPLMRLGAGLGEVQETFRMSGSFQLAVCWKDQDKAETLLPVVLEIKPYQLAPFHLEFPVFVLGCLFIGSILYGIYRRLEYLSAQREDAEVLIAE